MGARTTPVVPAAFEHAVAELTAARWRPELVIEEIPAPQRIAPYAVAISAEVQGEDGEEAGTGRLVLLHDPAGNTSWDGEFRCVTFARAIVDAEMAIDPLLPEVGWSWLIDALTSHDASYTEPSGTVTSVSSESFGGMEDEEPSAEVEVRASWSPVLTDGAGLAAHVQAWGELLCTTAGLPPLPAGVVAIPARRHAHKSQNRSPRRR